MFHYIFRNGSGPESCLGIHDNIKAEVLCSSSYMYSIDSIYLRGNGKAYIQKYAAAGQNRAQCTQNG